MNPPILKPNSSWFAPTVATVKRSTITIINIVDSYTPTTTPTDSWDASVAQDGGIMCYVDGTVLTIVGNGSGKIMANADSSWVFCDINKKDLYTSLTAINGLNILDTSNATTMAYMFAKLSKVTALDVSGFNTDKVESLEMMFSGDSLITQLDIGHWNTSACKSLNGTFDRVVSMTSIDIADWDTSNVTDMRYLFNGDTALTTLDVSKWNTSKVTTFFAMCQNCTVLTSFDVSKWDTSSATNMAFMFYSCDGLTELAVDDWNVQNVTTLDHTFAHCDNLKVNVSKWVVTNKCKYLDCVFHSNANTYLDVSGFDTSNVISMFSMFEANNYLEKIDGLENFDTSSCHAFEEMFSGCYVLRELDLSSFDTRKADSDTAARSDGNGYKSQCTKNMFAGCRSLEKIKLGENFTFAGDGTAASSYYGTLPTPSSTYITNADGSWHAETGEVYTSANVPNLSANVYYAYPVSVLMKGSDFCATIPSAAKSVVFTETAPSASVTLTNVGAGGNSSVVAWLDGTTYYVYCQGAGKYLANTDCSYMFSGKTTLTSIDTGNLDTSSTTNMEYMFGHSAAMKLASITFGENFNTSHVTNMLGIFRFCASLTTLDVSGFDTSSCVTLERMFDRCQNLQALDCSGFDTSNVTTMYCMFQVCNALTTIGDVSGWNLSKCTNTRNLFNNCFVLNGVDVSNWDVSKVTDMQSMFSKCQKLTALDVSRWDTSSVTNMAFTFNFCELVPVLDVSNWDVSNVQSFNTMFQHCKTVTELDVSKWDTSSCTNMAFMLYGMDELTSIDFSNWDVSNVTNFDHFLAHTSNLIDYDVSKWNITSACTNLYAAFHSTKVASIDVTGWDVSNVIAFGQMFEAMSNLTEIKGLNTWDTSSSIDFAQMFSGCSKLKELDLSSFDMTHANTNGTKVSSNGSIASCTIGMFNGMSSLEKIIVGEKFTMLGDGTAVAQGIGSFPISTSGYWYTEDGAEYAPADVPNLTYAVYYASPDIMAAVVWDRDSKKYMHLAAMRVYHDLANAYVNEQLDILRESLDEADYLTPEDIHSLFA